MSIHEQHLHPANLVQHLDDVRLYGFKRVHLGREISVDSLQTIGFLDPTKAIVLSQARFAGCGLRVDLLFCLLRLTRFPSRLTD